VPGEDEAVDVKRILIIDSDVFNVASISQMLLEKGYRILHATDQLKASKVLKKERPDLIICDLDGQTLDANVLMSTLQRMPRMRGIPFLFLARSRKLTDAAPDILGPKLYLTKPFTREQLAAAVEEHLKTGNQGDPNNRTEAGRRARR
jgi:CheY-like chemotaxis protein